MPESQSWALATQQAYAAGKAPKKYGTKEGKKEALKKYDDPKSTYKKTADPSSKSKSAGLGLDFLNGFYDELEKIAVVGVADITKQVKNTPTLTSKPKLVSKPTITELETPGTTIDQLGNSRTTPPPPVTAGGN